MTRQGEGSLSVGQVAEVLKLLQGSDSVELKLSVPDADRRSAVAHLGIDLLAEQQTKTKTALEFFAGEFAGVGASDGD